MSKIKNDLPRFILYCILLGGGLYEVFFTGNFSSYSTSGKVKSIIVLAILGVLMTLYFFKSKTEE